MTTNRQPVLRSVTVAAIATMTGALAGAPKSYADDPPMHQVTYTVSAKSPIYADIYYGDQDPAVFSDYSHNNYQFTPNIQADIAPGKPWTMQVMLADPDQWAVVTASTGRQQGTPQFHCDLAVDGVVKVSKDGPRGVLCSLRIW